MRKVNRSALIPYSAEQMYALVEDFLAYPDFLPWCTGAVLHLKDGSVIEELGTDGSKVMLDLEFEFENQVTDTLFGRYFEDTCNSLISSFTARAQKIYG